MPQSRRELILCALGPRPEKTVTLEALQAIKGCGTLFSDALTPGLRRRLKPFCRDCRAVASGDGPPAELRRRAAGILAAAKDGISVAYAGLGQPMIFGPLARELHRLARSRRIDVRVVGGLSAFDEYLVGQGEVFGYGRRWYQALDDCSPKALASLGPLNGGLPTVAFQRGGAGRVSRRALAAILQTAYPNQEECRLFEMSETGPMKSRGLKLARLGEEAGSKHSGLVVVEPSSPYGRA